MAPSAPSLERWRRAYPALRRSALLHALSHLLETPAQLLLQGIVLHTLQRGEVSRELALLPLQQIETLALQREKRIDESREAILVRGHAGHELGSHLLPHPPLTLRQRSSLTFESRVRLAQLHHLRVVQLQPLAHHLLEPLSDRLYEHLTPRISGAALPCLLTCLGLTCDRW